MRPKICVPIVASIRGQIMEEAKKIARLPVQMTEWRIDFYAGYERDILSIVDELRNVLWEKELVVTLRTEQEGGESNGSRFDYFALLEDMMRQGRADYVDVEIARDPVRLTALCHKYAGSHTRVIGSCHDFHQTPPKEYIVDMLLRARQCGCALGKFACMPENSADVDILLDATAECREKDPEFPIITMSMGKLGERSRLYGGLYGSEVSFGSVGQVSAPGQLSHEKMKEVFDKIYADARHIFLIGFMGTGKSAISKELQYRSGKPAIDTDRWIEQDEGRSISEIFGAEGEEYFRERETAMLDELGSMKPSIIACGGGMALREINSRKMRALGTVILLTAMPETILQRVGTNDSRPLLQNHKDVGYIRELMEKRMPAYRRAADLCIATDHRRVCDIAREILERI